MPSRSGGVLKVARLLRVHVVVELVDQARDLRVGDRGRVRDLRPAVAGRERGVVGDPDLDLVADAAQRVVLAVQAAVESRRARATGGRSRRAVSKRRPGRRTSALARCSGPGSPLSTSCSAAPHGCRSPSPTWSTWRTAQWPVLPPASSWPSPRRNRQRTAVFSSRDSPYRWCGGVACPVYVAANCRESYQLRLAVVVVNGALAPVQPFGCAEARPDADLVAVRIDRCGRQPPG